MPATGLRTEFKMETRGRYTTVECEVGMKVNGNELPNMETLGKALEAGVAEIQRIIKESYTTVPERV